MSNRCETCGFRNCICDMEGSFAPRTTKAHLECQAVDFAATFARQAPTWEGYLHRLEDDIDLALSF